MRRLAALGLVAALAACSHAPEKVMTEKDYYDAAQKSLKYGNFETATKHLEALESHYPVGTYTEQAQLELIYARFKHLDYPGTVSAAERFIRLHPQNPQLDYVYYLRALANFESDRDGLLQTFGQNIAYRDTANFHQSFDNLRELTTRFPTSPYAGDARQRMIWLRNQFAEAEMHIARYYLKRGTWISALNRARWVVENYPQTPQTPEALAMTVYCYQKLGTPDLADSSLALLRANYPDYVDAKGRVRIDLGPQNEKRSWLNMATFGLIGSRDVDTRADDVPAANPPPPKAQ